jgi:hypothetical protein
LDLQGDRVRGENIDDRVEGKGSRGKGGDGKGTGGDLGKGCRAYNSRRRRREKDAA